MRLLLLAAFLAGAAPAAAGGALSWEDCVAEARAKNADLKQAGESVRQARAEHSKALSQFLPRASASASWSQGGDYEPLDGAFGKFYEPAPSTSHSLGLNVSQNLFAGFSSLAALASTKAGLALAEQAARETRARVAFELRSAFYGLLFAQEQVELNDDIARRRKENVDLVELRYQAGREHKGSYLQTRALSTQANFEAARSRRERGDQAFLLARVLGREPDPGLSLRGSFEPATPPAEPDYAAQAAQLPGPLRALASLEQSKAGLTQANAAFLPSLGVSAGLNRSGTQWAPQNGSWSASLSLSYPLFSGFSDLASRSQASSRLRAAEAELGEARRQAMLDLRQAWSSLADAWEAAAVQEQFLEASLVHAEISRAQYTQGLLSFQNWDQIESGLINSRRGALGSRRDAVMADASWQRVLGKGLEP